MNATTKDDKPVFVAQQYVPPVVANTPPLVLPTLPTIRIQCAGCGTTDGVSYHGQLHYRFYCGPCALQPEPVHVMVDERLAEMHAKQIVESYPQAFKKS